MSNGTAGNRHTTRTRQTKEVDNIDTDGSGQFTITFEALRRIRSIGDVSIFSVDGYVVNPVSVSGNQVTCEVYESAGSAAALALNTGSTDLTDVRATAVGA